MSRSASNRTRRDGFSYSERAANARPVNRPYSRREPRVIDEDGEDLDDAINGLKLLTKKGSKPDPEAVEAVKIFRETLGRLKDQAGGEAADFRSDTGMRVMLRAMLATTLELIPTAAEKYTQEKNESAAYAYNALINQCKDIQSQLRSLDSLDEQADHIADTILVRANVAVGQNLISGLMVMKSRITGSNAPLAVKTDMREALESMVREHVRFVDEQLKATKEQVRAYLLGDVARVPSKPVKKQPRRA